MNELTLTDLLELSSSPSASIGERFDAVLSAYQQAKSGGRMTDVLSAMLHLREAASALTPTQRVELEVTIASIEFDIGLADSAQHRLEACKAEADRAESVQLCRVG